MAKCNVRYKLSGSVTSEKNFPFAGFSDRSVSLTVGGSVVSQVTTVANTTETTILTASSTLGAQVDLLVFVPTVTGTLAWRSSASTADTSSVEILANTPFFLPNPHVAAYSAAADQVTTATATTNVGTIYYFYQSSGSAAKMTVYGVGTDS